MGGWLPDGTTQADIDAQFADDEPEYEPEYDTFWERVDRAMEACDE